MKGDTDPLIVKRNRSDIFNANIDNKRSWPNKIGRFIYKTLRVLYTSFIFYFLPYLALFIPQLVVLIWP